MTVIGLPHAWTAAALETLTEKVRWQAIVPYVLGCVVAWVCNEVGIGITQLNGIVVALVMVWVFGMRSGRTFARAR